MCELLLNVESIWTLCSETNPVLTEEQANRPAPKHIKKYLSIIQLPLYVVPDQDSFQQLKYTILFGTF